MMNDDQYSSFDQLFDREKSGTDYRIVVKDRGSACLITAPHGGEIEPGTSESARSIAGDDKSFYMFEGLSSRPHHELHVKSHLYDEPQAINIAEKCDIIVAIHGCEDRDDPETVWVGGRDDETGRRIKSELVHAGFSAAVEANKLAGTRADNICNRGQRLRGVQLEIPRSLRDELLSNQKRHSAFSEAIRKALSTERE